MDQTTNTDRIVIHHHTICQSSNDMREFHKKCKTFMTMRNAMNILTYLPYCREKRDENLFELFICIPLRLTLYDIQQNQEKCQSTVFRYIIK